MNGGICVVNEVKSDAILPWDPMALNGQTPCYFREISQAPCRTSWSWVDRLADGFFWRKHVSGIVSSKNSSKATFKKTKMNKIISCLLVVSTHLKNIIVKLAIFPKFRDENSQNIWNHQLDKGFIRQGKHGGVFITCSCNPQKVLTTSLIVWKGPFQRKGVRKRFPVQNSLSGASCENPGAVGPRLLFKKKQLRKW